MNWQRDRDARARGRFQRGVSGANASFALLRGAFSVSQSTRCKNKLFSKTNCGKPNLAAELHGVTTRLKTSKLRPEAAQAVAVNPISLTDELVKLVSSVRTCRINLVNCIPSHVLELGWRWVKYPNRFEFVSAADPLKELFPFSDRFSGRFLERLFASGRA